MNKNSQHIVRCPICHRENVRVSHHLMEQHRNTTSGEICWGSMRARKQAEKMLRQQRPPEKWRPEKKPKI